jgi:hypothetical protein
MRNLNRFSLVLIGWPWGPVLLISMGLVLGGWPEHMEGPTLIDIGIGHGHGLTVANVSALLPFSIGVAYLCLGAWYKRTDLMRVIYARRFAFGLILIEFSIGSTFLVASGPSTILRLWTVGTFFSVLALIGFAASVSYPDQR